MKRLVECVPNFSEGRRPEVLAEIVRAIESVAGALLLDHQMDPDHNRAVVTFAGPPEAVAEAALRAVGCAAARIDLTRHSGVHPRIGAADVVPFVPLEGMTLEDCVPLAHQVGAEIWRRFQVPVYFYEAAARSPERAALEKIRREAGSNLLPDLGGPGLHPTAGATVVGARRFLIAYNVVLATSDVETARRIARRVRASSGGLPFVKAMGVLLSRPQPRAQVSMNLTNFEVTPVHVAYEAVAREAAAEGVSIESSELIGLIPQRAFDLSPEFFRSVENFHPRLILENRLAETARQ
jgi:glutamate formiminotransferase / formiminotetrahydrofolate cyclodeaminase